jgi:phosphoadenosine phosphosulfate reductase
MPRAALELCVPPPGQHWSGTQLASVAPCLERLNAAERVQWALDYLPGPPLMTSSFGAQSAVMLHLVTQSVPDIPVVLIDTGYLFPETYRFADELAERLSLNLQVFRPRLSPAWQESRYGRLWEQGVEGIRRYNQMNKVEPMAQALETLGARTWFSGLRRSQAASRRDTPILKRHGNVVKVHPLADWNDRDIHAYLAAHDLPYHPLWHQGYVSIGDHHTSHPLGAGEEAEEARFFGLVRECGLHEPERFRQMAGDSGAGGS